VAALVALNAAVFAHEASFDVALWSLVPFNLTHGVQLPPPAPPLAATLVSFQFLHGSVVHVLSNMLVLATFGPEIEALLGHLRFLAFYLLCGVLGGLAQVSAMPGSHVPSLGASAAIAGVLGAYALHFPTRELIWQIPAVLVIALWIVAQFVHGFGPGSERALAEQGGGIAYFAHIGGFLAGVLLSGLFIVRNGPRRGAAA
jgi:membrane associated rhomboid family serine protease